jgi:glutamyl-tRNA reductase
VHLFLLGVSHKTAPVELRERLDFSSRDLGAAVEALASRPGAAESVVLSTCNRSELYVAAENVERAKEDLVAFLSDYHQIPSETFLPHVFAREDADAVRHLFRVAAGLDSLVVGEPQILGQVKEAYATASERHSSGPLLTKLFHSSFAVGKRVRTETALGEGAVSVSYTAVQLARKIFGKLTGRRVLVIGAGEMGKLTAQHLRTQGVGEIVITSRTLGRAQELANAVDGTAAPWSDLMTVLARADIVITATGSQVPILTRAEIESVIGRPRHDPLFIIDIAIPRDVDPDAGNIEQVFLYNVDDLQMIVQENLSRRSAEMDRAELIVAEEVGRFMAWHRSRGAIPTVVALRQRFEAIRRAELQRLESKLAGLPPEARARVEEITRIIMEKLLLEPTEQLKALPDEETQVLYTEAVNRLFGLRGEERVSREE